VNASGCLVGRPSSGLRACRWTMAAPASAAPTAASAISCGVTGRCGDMRAGVWIEPVTAQVMMTLRKSVQARHDTRQRRLAIGSGQRHDAQAPARQPCRAGEIGRAADAADQASTGMFEIGLTEEVDAEGRVHRDETRHRRESPDIMGDVAALDGEVPELAEMAVEFGRADPDAARMREAAVESRRLAEPERAIAQHARLQAQVPAVVQQPEQALGHLAEAGLERAAILDEARDMARDDLRRCAWSAGRIGRQRRIDLAGEGESVIGQRLGAGNGRHPRVDQGESAPAPGLDKRGELDGCAERAAPLRIRRRHRDHAAIDADALPDMVDEARKRDRQMAEPALLLGAAQARLHEQARHFDAGIKRVERVDATRLMPGTTLVRDAQVARPLRPLGQRLEQIDRLGRRARHIEAFARRDRLGERRRWRRLWSRHHRVRTGRRRRGAAPARARPASDAGCRAFFRRARPCRHRAAPQRPRRPGAHAPPRPRTARTPR
jgi:hypothetical protein